MNETVVPRGSRGRSRAAITGADLAVVLPAVGQAPAGSLSLRRVHTARREIGQ
jgi:hypothetical protein